MGATEEMSIRVDQKILKRFGHVEQIVEWDEQLTKKVCKLAVGGVRGRWKPHFRWTDGVKDACKDRRMGLAIVRRRCRIWSEWGAMTGKIL